MGFTAEPGALLRSHIPVERAERLSDPESADAPVPWLDVRANNLGFFNTSDYPVVDIDGIDDPFFIGVFGGSAAHWFALQAGPGLAQAVDGHPDVAGRRAVTLNCAVGGMKQPQPLLCLNWLLSEGQHFDLIVLIDGFNEAALSYVNVLSGERATAPSVEHMRRFDSEAPPADIAANERFGKADATRIADHWAHCSILFQQACGAAEIPLVHVLQPNQYHCAKRFTLRERKWAISRTSPYRTAVEEIYPLLIKRLPRLEAQDHHVVDGTTVFDHSTRTVFSDNCCHYNVRGNLMLQDLIVQALPEDLSGRRRSAAFGSTERPEQFDSPGDSASRAAGDGDDLYPMW